MVLLQKYFRDINRDVKNSSFRLIPFCETRGNFQPPAMFAKAKYYLNYSCNKIIPAQLGCIRKNLNAQFGILPIREYPEFEICDRMYVLGGVA